MKKWLIVTIMVFLAVCGQAQTKKGPVKKTISKTTSGSSQVGSVARGKILYETHCRTCHQADGGGVPNMNPPLINTSYVLGSKSKLIGIVLNGFSERVEIEGETYSNNMPPFNTLNDQQIADVLTFIRKSFGNKASAVQAAEVKKVRSGVKK